jgi:hypothetical protein
MAKKYYYCHYCEEGTEAKAETGKAVFCRTCGRLINLNELKELTLSHLKKPSNVYKFKK